MVTLTSGNSTWPRLCLRMRSLTSAATFDLPKKLARNVAMDSFVLLRVRAPVAMSVTNASAVYPLLSDYTSFHVLSSCFKRSQCQTRSFAATLRVFADHNEVTGAVRQNFIQSVTAERKKEKAGQVPADSTALGVSVRVRYQWCM